MARINWPEWVASGDNSRAHCVAHTPNGVLKDGVGGDGFPSDAVTNSANGDRWNALGDMMFAATAASLSPAKQMAKQMSGKTRK